MQKIRLTKHELEFAGKVGFERNLGCLLSGEGPRNGLVSPARIKFNDFIISAWGEMAVAKALGLYWPPQIGEAFQDGDLGPGMVECRLRRVKVGRDMGIWPTDKEERPFVLVYDYAPEFHLMGWAYPIVGKQLGVWNEKSNCYFLRPNFLQPIETLHEELAATHQSKIQGSLIFFENASVAQLENAPDYESGR